MTNETLRMQMLAGIITESQYKEKLNEQTDTGFLRSEMERHIGEINNNPEITDPEKKRRIDNIRFVVYDFLDPNTNGGTRPSSDFQFDDNWWNSISPDIDKWVVDDAATDLVRAAKGASFGENDKPLNERDSLNESMVGGIVGIGAVTQIPSREKTDYETAFEHFLGERYQLKPNRERDDIKDINEEEVEEDLNESALAIAGGVILGVLGLKVIFKIIKGISGAVSLIRMTDPKELKKAVAEIGKEAMQRGKNPLQIALWMSTVESMIDNGEIKNGVELGKTWGNVDKIDLEKAFSSSESKEVEEPNNY